MSEITKYAEVIYEPGSKSVVSYEDLDELKAGLVEHHRRALAGEPGAAQDQEVRDDVDYSSPGMVHPDTARLRPAERITRVITYDVHPSEFNRDGVVHTDELDELIAGMKGSDGCVNIEQLRSALIDEASPTYPNDQGRHESMFKMDGTELSTEFLNDV